MPNTPVVGFGSAGRVALTAVRALRAEGIPVGLLRPITLAPFPARAIGELAPRVKGMLVVEMNAGQMLDDVLLADSCRTPVEFFGRNWAGSPRFRKRSPPRSAGMAPDPTTRKATPATAGWRGSLPFARRSLWLLNISNTPLSIPARNP